MDDKIILSTQGLLLTLVSLLGTFFYVHLSNWRKDIIKLDAIWEQNQFNQTEEEKAALQKIRWELPGTSNFVTPLVTAVISAFIILVSVLSGILWTFYSGEVVIKMLLLIAGSAFLLLYLILTSIFLFGGLKTTKKLKKEIAKIFDEDSSD